MSARTFTNGQNMPIRPTIAPLGSNSIATVILRQLVAWQDRAFMRSHLAELDEYYLTDSGLSPADVRDETRKAFWQA
ncbi:DUF1127 domain-containing protein [Sneathiella sp.]|uniref:DUF1127 domain-containing protein n=1 Tax=Sneathiella sp. TaxID=1964365 RepID=UPI002FE378C9